MSSVTQSVVQQDFANILFRAPTTAELSEYSSGFYSTSSLISTLETSQEALNFVDPIAVMYQACFNRAPDTTASAANGNQTFGGLGYWVAGFESAALGSTAFSADALGKAIGTAAYNTAFLNIATNFVSILDGQLFGAQSATPASNTVFVQTVYQQLFSNFDPTGAGEAKYITELQQGTSAGTVLMQLVQAALNVSASGTAGTQAVANLAAVEAWESNLATTGVNSGTPIAIGTNANIAATAPVYTLSTASTSATEGSTVIFHLATSNVAAGTILNYTLSGVTASEVIGGTLTGQVTVASDGSANIQVNLNSTPGEGLSGNLSATLSVPSGASTSSVLTSAVPLTENSTFTVGATQIVAANAALSPVVVATPATGNVSVIVQSTGVLYSQHGGIVVSGNANTAVTYSATGAGANETLYVTGSGTNSVTFTGTTGAPVAGDNIVGGTGQLTINATNVTMGAGESWNAGSGTSNTINVYGTDDLSAGSLANIQSVTMHSTLKLNATEAKGLTSVSEAAGGTGALTIVADGTTADTLNLSGKLSGIKTLTIDGTGAGVHPLNVTLAASDLVGVTSVTLANSGTITTTVAGATALLAINPNITYTLNDTAANIAGASAAVLNGATGGVSTGTTGTVSISLAETLHTANASATYTVGDTAANLIGDLIYDDYSAVLKAAHASETVTGSLTVAQELALKPAATTAINAGYVIADTANNIAAQLTPLAGLGTGNFGTMTGSTPAVSGIVFSGTATVANANTIGSQLVAAGAAVTSALSGSYVVSDTEADLLGLALTANALHYASGVQLSDHATDTVANLVIVKAHAGGSFTGAFDISDTAANVLGNTAIADAATNITLSDASVGVAIAAQIAALTNSGTTGYTLSDTAANLVGASAKVLADATGTLTATGNTTVAQAAAVLAEATNATTIHYALSDTVANLLAAPASVIAGTHATSITATGTATLAQAVSLYTTVSATAVYSVSDTVAALDAAVTATGYGSSNNQLALNQAATVTATGNATAAQALDLYNANFKGSHAGVWTVSDTYANIINGANANGVNNAASIAVTDASLNALQVHNLRANYTHFNGVYTLVDTAANVANELGAASITAADINNASNTVVLTGFVTLAQATTLTGASLTKWDGHYTIADSYAALSAGGVLTSSVFTGAQADYISDSVANVNANLAWINAHTNGYYLSDSITNLDAGGVTTSTAKGVSVTVGDTGSAITAAHATTLYGLNAAASYAVNDTAANLIASGNNAGVQHAAAITVSVATSVANVQTIKALDPTATVTYSLSDTAANLAASTASLVTGASAVALSTGSATVAQATAIRGENSAFTYTLTDTAANLQAGSAAVIEGASSAVVSGGNRVALSYAEISAANLDNGTPGATIANWTSSGTGLGGSNTVSYDLTDTVANLLTAVGNSASWISDAGKVTATGGTTTVANIQTLVADAATVGGVQQFFGTYGLQDSITNLLAGGSVVSNATAVSISAGNGDTGSAITAAHAKSLYTLNHAASYAVTDTDANLTGANLTTNSTGVAHATAVTVSTAAAVADIVAIEAVNTSGHYTYTLSDTAANLAAASASVLHGASSIALSSGTATVAQLAAIDAGVGSNVTGLAVKDTAANLATAGNELAGNTISLNSSSATATIAQLQAIDTGAGATQNLKVSDTVADFVAMTATQTADVHADTATVTVTGTATAAQAATLDTLTSNGGVTHLTYAVSDTAANLLANTTGWATATGHASAVTVSDASVSVATAYSLYTDNNSVVQTISDTQDRVAQALHQIAGDPIANINTVLGHAQSVSVTGGPTLSLVSQGGSYRVTGSVATISGLSTALTSATTANGYVVNDTLANEQAALALTTGGVAYYITDSAANITTATPSFVSGAAKITLSDTSVTNAQAQSVFAANGTLADVTYTLSDSYANISANTNSVETDAATITVTGTVTDAQAQTLIGNHAFNAGFTNDRYSISDSSANIAAINANVANETAKAQSVTVTGTITGAQATTLFGLNANSTYAIQDSTIGNIFSNTSTGVFQAGVANATSITGTYNGGNALTVADANALVALGAKFTGTYALSDTAANLAAASSTILHSATAIAETTNATVAQLTAIDAGHGSNVNLTVSDTAANIAGASQALLTPVTTLTATGTVTAVQADTLQGLTYNSGASHVGYAISDTSANILAAGNSLGVAGAGNTAITATDTISIGTADTIRSASNGTAQLDLHISDNSTNIELANAGDTSHALSINVTDTINVGSESFIAANFGTVSTVFSFAKIADAESNLVTVSSAVVSETTAFSVTDASLSVANTEALLASAVGTSGKLVGGYVISDLTANVISAYWDADHQAAITGATGVSVSDNTGLTVSQATVLTSLSNLTNSVANSNALTITDSLGNVAAASLSVLNSNHVNGITATAVLDHGAAGQTFADTGITSAVTLSVTAGAGAAETIGAAAGQVYSGLAGVDLLTLKLGDTIDLTGLGISGAGGTLHNQTTAQVLPVALATGVEVIEGNITAGGSTFTASATGTSTLVLFYDGNHTAAIELVGVLPTQIQGTGADATHIYLHI